MTRHRAASPPNRSRCAWPGMLAGALLFVTLGVTARVVEAQAPATPSQTVILVTPEGVSTETLAKEEVGRGRQPDAVQEGTGTVHDVEQVTDDSSRGTDSREGVADHRATEQSGSAGAGAR